MSLITDIEKSYKQISLIEDISGIFEGIASIRIRQIKNHVVTSKNFFDQLWQIYHQLRVGTGATVNRPKIKKSVIIVITSAGGLSGEIDNKIIEQVSSRYNAAKMDIIVFGEHGAVLLAERKIRPIKVFTLPNIHKNFDISPVIRMIEKYSKATVYYQTFVSLAVQKVGMIDLILQVGDSKTGSDKLSTSQLISEADYEFEPSISEVTSYMESVMLGIALQQMLLESRLAQFASRFSAMVLANNRAKQVKHDTKLKLMAAKRAKRDEASRQVMPSGSI